MAQSTFAFTDGPVVFADGKAPNAMRTIGEVAAGLGIKQHILRYWEQQFPMLKPLKRSGGRRLYRPQDVELVAAIDRLLNHQGYTIRGALAALKAGRLEEPAIAKMPPAGQGAGPVPGATPTQGPADPALASPEFVVRLKDIRRRLSAALEAA